MRPGSPTGCANWRAACCALTSDPDLRIAARLKIGWSLLWSNRNAEALDTLLSVAADALVRRPAIAWDAVGLAATIAHQTGLPDARRQGARRPARAWSPLGAAGAGHTGLAGQ